MFDLANLDQMKRGRIQKHLNSLTRLNGDPRVMTCETMYAEHNATHKYIGLDHNGKRYYGLRSEPQGLIIDIPKMLYDCCTLPEFKRGA